jgi:hypothetical protein
MRLTLPIISMVITFLSLLLKISAGKWNTLVNFESASTRLSGQFSVGVNTVVKHGKEKPLQIKDLQGLVW